MNISNQDIQKYYDEKQLKKKKTYNKIILRIMRLMKETAENGKNMCMYVVPEIILGMPIYNMKECILYIQNTLEQKGFQSAHAEPNIILIFWKLENKLIKKEINEQYNFKIEDKKSSIYQSNNISDNVKTVNYNSVKEINVPQTFFFNH